MVRMLGLLGAAAVALGLTLELLVEPAAAACPPDSVESGTVCMDKYEASVWYVPPSMTTLIRRIQNGGVTLANLTAPNAAAAGVVQLGLVSPVPPRATSLDAVRWTATAASTSMPSRSRESCRRSGSRGLRPPLRPATPSSDCRPTRSGRWLLWARRMAPRATKTTSSAPGASPPASRTSGPSTWWATSGSGRGLGCEITAV